MDSLMKLKTENVFETASVDIDFLKLESFVDYRSHGSYL